MLSNVNLLALSARPVATNLAGITARLAEPGGSLGRWLFPTNFNEQLDTTLTSATLAFTNLNTNLVLVVEKLGVSLDNLAEITSNLNVQVQANTNVLGDLSNFVIHTDELVQGLKKHWFLKSAFKSKTNKPPPRP